MMKQWHQLRNELGWQGVSGILLLLIGLMFSDSVLGPAEERATQAREKAQGQHQRTALGQEMQSELPAVMLQKYYDFFTTDQEITDQLARIYNVAQANGLELRQGDYKVVRAKGERMTQYQITLPLAGGYNQIRRFAAQVLVEMPTLALDQIKFERKQANDSTIEAQIMLTLYRVQP